LGLELEHAAHLLFRGDVAIGDAAGVQRHVGRQRGKELRLLRRVGRRGQQAEAVGHTIAFRLSMILSENRCPLFGIMLFRLSMILSENRYPLFGIMLYCVPSRPAVLMTAWNFSVSALMKRVNSSGLLLLTGLAPCLVIASLTSGMSSTFTSAACSLSM